MTVPRFVSEPIEPVTDGTLDAAALSAGEPSLPGAFRWRGELREVREVLEAGKGYKTEGFSGEKYLKRHEWRLMMDDGAVWQVYFVRGGKRGSKAARWFLKAVE
ncbi:DUF6504 family protein [bacterium]|nr:DUF6504 family protein [bacterium]